MPLNRRFIWDDEHFTVQAGAIGGREITGPELGRGIIYYPNDVTLTHHLGSIDIRNAPRPSPREFRILWSTGVPFERFTTGQPSCPFVRVDFKPSPQLAAELPDDFLGLASAALLQSDWAEPFKDSVHADVDAIGMFVEELRSGHAPGPESFERAVLAREDLELKLLWLAGEYRRRGVFGRGVHALAYSTTTLAAATPATGMITVTVNTKDPANAAVSGWAVWYVTYINRNNAGFYASFSQFSTPTSEPMGVGNYEMWTEKGGATGPKRKIPIRSTTTTQSVDLWTL
jgi:hypothetical protein